MVAVQSLQTHTQKDPLIAEGLGDNAAGVATGDNAGNTEGSVNNNSASTATRSPTSDRRTCTRVCGMHAVMPRLTQSNAQFATVANTAEATMISTVCNKRGSVLKGVDLEDTPIAALPLHRSIAESPGASSNALWGLTQTNFSYQFLAYSSWHPSKGFVHAAFQQYW